MATSVAETLAKWPVAIMWQLREIGVAAVILLNNEKYK